MAPLIWTAGDMIAEVRAGVAEPNDGFYTEDEFLRWLNMGAMDFVTRTRIHTSDALASSVVGQKKYGLPNDFILVEKVSYQDVELEPTDLHRLLTVTPMSGLDTQGGVEFYYIRGAADSQLCLFLWKVPSASVPNAIRIYYVQKPEVMVNEGSSFPLSSEWAPAVIAYAKVRAHQKQRQHLDADRAMAEYQDLVGIAMERRGLRHQIDRPTEIEPEETWNLRGWRGARTW